VVPTIDGFQPNFVCVSSPFLFHLAQCSRRMSDITDIAVFCILLLPGVVSPLYIPYDKKQFN
jgi:hypothetical protein